MIIRSLIYDKQLMANWSAIIVAILKSGMDPLCTAHAFNFLKSTELAFRLSTFLLIQRKIICHLYADCVCSGNEISIYRTSIFEKHRSEYLSDDDYRLFQCALLAEPNKGDVIQDSGGLRKVRAAAKGKAWWCTSNLLPL